MTIRKIAKTFGVSVKDFCNLIGYSRQYLYLRDKGEINLHPKRWQSAMLALEFKINRDYTEAMQKAEDDKKARMELLEELKKWSSEKEARA